MIKTGLKIMLLMTVMTGLLYPLLITLIAQIVFPWQANGSMIEQQGKLMGSELIGQHFTSPKDFWGRPSSTQPTPYNAKQSSGSNFGPSNPAFIQAVQQRVQMLRHQHPSFTEPLPAELVTASGSGLDPHISPTAAMLQVSRVAVANHLPEEDVHALVEAHIESRTWKVLGEPRVNVLKLNLALEQLRSGHAGSTSESR